MRPVGFSNGLAPFALKNPPPFVPSCLMTSCEATARAGWSAHAVERVVDVAGPPRVCTAPCAMKMTAATSAIGSRM